MNWSYFLIFMYLLTIMGLIIGAIQGALNQPRDTNNYSTGYGALCAIILVILILMWFWT